MIENEITERILKSAFKVHTALGPGLLESSYKECLSYEMKKHGLFVEKEKPMPLIYEEVKLDIGYRLDLLVNNKVVIEIKTVECFNDVHLAQILTYMRLGNCKVGLLLNFKVASLKHGIKRMIL
ncbi:GxxExxY protein [Ferruginibacter sp.]|nr:GxxExxY protein [Ferruginibacter sp.]